MGRKLRLLIKIERAREGFSEAQGNDCRAKFLVPFSLPCKGFQGQWMGTARVGKGTGGMGALKSMRRNIWSPWMPFGSCYYYYYFFKWADPHLGRKKPWSQLLLQTPEGQGKSKCLRQADSTQQQRLHAGGSAARKSSVPGVGALWGEFILLQWFLTSSSGKQRSWLVGLLSEAKSLIHMK